MGKSILIVDDDSELVDAIQMVLETAGYEVVTAENGTQALQILQEKPVVLILADIAMPGMNGYQLFNLVSQHPQWKYIPFLFISGRGLDSDVRYGKELGADDYLIKPIQSVDLLAAIRGRLKRAMRWRELVVSDSIASTDTEELSYGNLKINFAQHRLWLDDNLIQLSAFEFRLLAFLAKQPGRVVPHQTLIKATHQLETDEQDAGRLLRPLVRSLRRKLGYLAGNMGCIENIRGVGYQFIYQEKTAD